MSTTTLEQRLVALAQKVDLRLQSLNRLTSTLQSKIPVGPVPPSSPNVNDLWVDTGA